ncbi:MAG: transglycosylase, partial [Gammaproteobacteria bacterium]
LLQTREMKRIQDARTRMLCAIAAYNTGGGNVASAFISGSHDIARASEMINRMSYGEVYEYLRSHLPAQETRDYVQKVRDYMNNYRALDGAR